MAVMPEFTNGELIDANKWNAHANQINENTETIGQMEATMPGSNSGYGSFYQNVSQSIIQNNTEQRLIWDSVDGAANNVVRADGNRSITLQKGGVWIISVFARFAEAFNANRIVMWLGPPTSGTADRYGFSMIQPTSSLLDPGVSFSIQRRFAAGESFSAYLYQDSSENRNTMTNFNSTAITMSYLGE